MGLGAIVVWIIVGLIAGFLASKVVSGHGLGLLWDIVVGILGAFVGGWLASLLGFAVTNILVQIVVAFIGAVILLIIFRAVAGRSRMHA
ncbi:MAG TPA: GlsB/YeaQ/YmgE family stress response membrane protein [Candidatus Dormibacteraeota bacterium]